MEYSARQIRAIQQAISLGRKLQEDIPEIAEDYKNRKNKRQITEKYKIAEIYGVDEKIACAAVGYALRGNKGFSKTKLYEGLIKENSELERLATEHMRDNFEKIKEDLSYEQLQDSGRKSIIAQGGILWSDEEKEFVYQLSKKLKYKEKGKIRIRKKLITKETNKRFHDNKQIRTVSSINNFLTHYEKIRGKWIRVRR